MNKITATGRLSADAEVRFTSSGDPVASFRLASDVGYGDKKTTNWFSCQLWGKRAEALSPYLTKGLPVTVFGSLTLRAWQDKNGQEKISPDIRIDEIELQGGKQAEKSAPAPQRNAQGGSKDSFSDMDNYIPFSRLGSGKTWRVI